GNGILGCRLGHEQRRLQSPNALVGPAGKGCRLADAVEHRPADAVVRESPEAHTPRLVEAARRLEQALEAHLAQVVEVDVTPYLPQHLAGDDIDQLAVLVESREHLGGVFRRGQGNVTIGKTGLGCQEAARTALFAPRVRLPRCSPRTAIRRTVGRQRPRARWLCARIRPLVPGARISSWRTTSNFAARVSGSARRWLAMPSSPR